MPAAKLPPQDCRARYTEELLIGYRFYDAHGILPAFPFGHGLSCTSFRYDDLHVSAAAGGSNISVGFTLANTGGRAGRELAQLYLHFPMAAGEPPKLLRRVLTVSLAAGESRHVTFEDPLPERDLAIWSESTHG
jgi:beta-glucosidase